MHSLKGKISIAKVKVAGRVIKEGSVLFHVLHEMLLSFMSIIIYIYISSN